ncbi:MAG TPA: cell division protein FtsQ/DivIB [Kofleriaceae bacterium]|nr:cell division protein FtsQ/DivIB [Kofleriaceae bacterium]
MRLPTLLVATSIAVAAPARADDFLPQTALPKAALAATSHGGGGDGGGGSSLIDLTLGVEAGGAPLLRAPDGPVAATTARTSVALFARVSIPMISERIVEVSWVPRHGWGLMLESGDLRLGAVKLHLLDLGVFYDSTSPITVSRVARRWDVAVGAGAELTMRRHLSLVADARMFAPIDIWSVVTRYGDTARLIGDEIMHGGQLWVGAAYHW